MKSISKVYLSEVENVYLELIKVYWSLLQISAQAIELSSAVEDMVLMLSHPVCTLKMLTKLLDFFERVRFLRLCA